MNSYFPQDYGLHIDGNLFYINPMLLFFSKTVIILLRVINLELHSSLQITSYVVLKYIVMCLTSYVVLKYIVMCLAYTLTLIQVQNLK